MNDSSTSLVVSETEGEFISGDKDPESLSISDLNKINVDGKDYYILLHDDDHPHFLIVIKDDLEYSMEFVVHEVIGWYAKDGVSIPNRLELYLKGSIEWDGCSHVWFGEEEDGKHDGYLHLCGKTFWDRHCEVMKKLFILASNSIEKFDTVSAD